MTNSEIRAKARQNLGGNIFANSWMLALVVALINTILTSVTGSVVPFIGSLLIYGPLMVGVSGYFLAQARQEKTPSLENMFNGFSDFGNNFVLGLLMYLFIFLWSLLFIIPGIVKSYAYSMAFYLKDEHPEWGWNGINL